MWWLIIMIQIITLTRAHSSVTEMFFTKSAVLFRKLLGWNTRSAIKQSFWISWIMLLCFFFFVFFPPLSREMVTLTTSKCRVFDEGFFFFCPARLYWKTALRTVRRGADSQFSYFLFLSSLLLPLLQRLRLSPLHTRSRHVISVMSR